MNVTGKLIAAMPKRSGISERTGNPWATRDYVLEYQSGEYTKKCAFRVVGEDKLASFDLHFGDVVTLYFDIDAHEYNGRWYTEIIAINVVKNGAKTNVETTQEAEQPTAVPNGQPAPPEGEAENKESDLPF